MIFDPSMASNAQILNLYHEVEKESTSRWKRAMKDGDQLIERKDKEKNHYRIALH